MAYKYTLSGKNCDLLNVKAGTTTGYSWQNEVQSSNPSESHDVFLSASCSPVLRSAQPPIQCVKWTGREAYHTSKYRRDNIWGFHGSDYEEWRFLGCYAV
jgi:hypothetical protein